MTYTLILLLCLLSVGCSTVSNLPKNELLYVGTQSISVADTPSSPLRNQAISEAKVAFVAPPNNALFGSSRYRSPFPIGLWAYNTFGKDSIGFRHWLFKTFATQPIYISTVNPTLRADIASNTLYNYGYFDNNVTYTTDTLADKRKAKLSYTLELGIPWYYGDVEYYGFAPAMDSIIHTFWDERLVREGEQMSYATLNSERNRLFMLFRERGYYYFRPEMIAILADTTTTRGTTGLRITPQPHLPPYAVKPWYIGNTYFTFYTQGSPVPTGADTSAPFLSRSMESGFSQAPSITYYYPHRRIPIRQSLLASRIALRRGAPYSLTAQDITLRELNGLGVLSTVSLHYAPRDSSHTADTLDVFIEALLDAPYELSLETNVTAKSNDQIGPGIVASLTRRNLLRMAETIQLRLRGSYEWQVGHTLRREGTVVNSFELGADASMSVPQLLFPGRYNAPYRRPVSTTTNLYGDWLHRGGYFRMLAFGGNLTYGFSSSGVTTHSITPFSLAFNTLEHTTARFDSIMTANPAIGISFRDQFVPSSSYALTYDNSPSSRRHSSRLTLSLSSAGALTSLLYAAIGRPLRERHKSLLGTPYAQFIKGSIEACHYLRLTPRQTIAMRLITGAIYAYGNSTAPPFSELYHIGGANDLRAFPLRGIGPGSYHATGRYAYIDHTGDLKLEANVEWRFPLVGQLSGALFIDAGNLWLLRDDPSRPGAQFRWDTFAQDIALGTGLGLRYNLRVLLLRCDVGVPLHIPYATGKRGYYNVPHFVRGLCIHFGIGYPF